MLKNESITELTRLMERTKLEPAFLAKERAFAETLGDKNPGNLTNEIAGHLQSEARPGSAEYMIVFGSSAVLDAELRLFEASKYDPDLLKEKGLEPMLDAKGMLTPDSHNELLSRFNSLNYALRSYLGRTAQKASEYYADQLTTPTNVFDRFKQALGFEAAPFEIPFTPDQHEVETLQALAERRYTSRDEAQQIYQRAIKDMMRRRPGAMGCAAVASTQEYMQGIINDMGGESTGQDAVDRLRRLHDIMNGQAMAELQIYEAYGIKIEDCVNKSYE